MIARPVVVVSRAHFVQDGDTRRFHSGDGPYLDEIAAGSQQMVLLAPVLTPAQAEKMSIRRACRYAFQSPNVAVAELPESAGARELGALLKTLWSQWRIIRAELKRHADAVVFLFFPTYRAAAAAVWCAWRGRPFIVYSGTVWSETIALSPRWQAGRPWYLGLYIAVSRRLERFVFRRAALRLFTEAAQIEAYRSVGPTHRSRPLTRIKIGPAPVSRARQNPPRILCVAERLPVKGHDVLYRALAEMPGVELHLAGGGDAACEAALDRLAAELGITARITDHGWIGDAAKLQELYRSADVFVLPSRSEGFPRVIYEAMAHGVPVVTTNIPNIAAVLQHEREALLTPPDNPSELAAAIRRALADRALADRLAQAGWAWTKEQFSEPASAQFLRLANDVLVRGAE